MKTKKEIEQELENLDKQIRKNLKDCNDEIENEHPISANLHWSHHNVLMGFRNGLLWVLKKEG
jgi:hypothetical protein